MIRVGGGGGEGGISSPDVWALTTRLHCGGCSDLHDRNTTAADGIHNDSTLHSSIQLSVICLI